MEEGPDMSRVKEPRSMIAVLVFAMIFMVGFGIWHGPILEFASQSVPALSQLAHAMSISPTIESISFLIVGLLSGIRKTKAKPDLLN